MERRHIVIFGGTFDPIHNGHLRSAVEVRETLGADGLWLLPSHQPPLRDCPSASSEQRLAMVSAAVHGESGLRVDARELLRDAPSFTVETLREIRTELGEQTAVTLLLGSDAVNKLHRWREWQSLLALANLLVLRRPDHQLALDAEVAAQLNAARCPAESLGLSACGRFSELALVQLAISATDIRARLASGRSARYLLPDAVLDFIYTQGLYGASAAPAKQRTQN